MSDLIERLRKALTDVAAQGISVADERERLRRELADCQAASRTIKAPDSPDSLALTDTERELAEARGLLRKMRPHLHAHWKAEIDAVLTTADQPTVTVATGSQAGWCRCGSDGSPYAPCICGGMRADKSTACNHEWVSAANEVVAGGWMCRKCHAISAEKE